MVVEEPTPKRTLPPGIWDNDVVRVVSVVEEIATGEKGRGREVKELLGLLQVSSLLSWLSAAMVCGRLLHDIWELAGTC